MTQPKVVIALVTPTLGMFTSLQEAAAIALHLAQDRFERALVPRFGIIDHTYEHVMIITGKPGETIVMRVRTDVPGLAETIAQQLRPVATKELFPACRWHIAATMSSDTYDRTLTTRVH